MRALVVGLGNPILKDDGVGVAVANRLAAVLPPPYRADLDITEACVGGLRLMEMLEGYDRVILIDALVLAEDPAPGRIHRWALADLRAASPTQHTASAHDTTLVTALDLGRSMGMHLPEEIIIFGVEVEEVTAFGEAHTPSVAASVPRAVQAVLAELQVPLESAHGRPPGRRQK